MEREIKISITEKNESKEKSEKEYYASSYLDPE